MTTFSICEHLLRMEYEERIDARPELSCIGKDMLELSKNSLKLIKPRNGNESAVLHKEEVTQLDADGCVKISKLLFGFC